MTREEMINKWCPEDESRQLLERDLDSVISVRLEMAEKCAEVLCTFAAMLPAECSARKDGSTCESESCGLCRAFDVCMPYMVARNAREAECG